MGIKTFGSVAGRVRFICVKSGPGILSKLLYYKSRDVSTQLPVLLRVVRSLTLLTKPKHERLSTSLTGMLLFSFSFCNHFVTSVLSVVLYFLDGTTAPATPETTANFSDRFCTEIRDTCSFATLRANVKRYGGSFHHFSHFLFG